MLCPFLSELSVLDTFHPKLYIKTSNSSFISAFNRNKLQKRKITFKQSHSTLYQDVFNNWPIYPKKLQNKPVPACRKRPWGKEPGECGRRIQRAINSPSQKVKHFYDLIHLFRVQYFLDARRCRVWSLSRTKKWTVATLLSGNWLKGSPMACDESP